MKVTLRLLYKPFLAVFLLFAVYGCQTTNSTVTSETPVTSHTSSVDQEASAASVTATGEADTKDKSEKETMEKFGTFFISRLSGHGGGAMPSDAAAEKEAVVQDKQVTDLAVKPAGTEKRPYIEMEKQLYGRWINKLETESYDFHGDGTVVIVIEGPRERTMKLTGNFMIVEADRIKIDFRNDTFASRRPPSYFKVSISENEFSLTDEPKKKDEPDGPTTVYNRVE